MTLQKRVDLLERHSRRYRNLFMLSALIIVALVSWGHTQIVPETIKAHEFIVVDRETGAPVAVLGQKAAGGALDLLDRNTNYVVYINVENDGKGRLTLCTPGGAMRRDCSTGVSP